MSVDRKQARELAAFIRSRPSDSNPALVLLEECEASEAADCLEALAKENEELKKAFQLTKDVLAKSKVSETNLAKENEALKLAAKNREGDVSYLKRERKNLRAEREEVFRSLAEAVADYRGRNALEVLGDAPEEAE